MFCSLVDYAEVTAFKCPLKFSVTCNKYILFLSMKDKTQLPNVNKHLIYGTNLAGEAYLCKIRYKPFV